MPLRALVQKEFRLLVRDRLSAILLIVMPLVFILLLGLLLGEGFGQKPDNRLRISLVSEDLGYAPRRAAGLFQALPFQGDHALIPAQHSGRGDDERGPFAMAAGAQRFTLDDDVRVDADRRVVDEDSPVDLADVDTHAATAGDHADRLVDIRRQAEIPGEVIERAERQNTQRHVRTEQRAGD